MCGRRPLDQRGPRPTELLAGRGQLGVPHVEGRRGIAVEAAADLAQQRVALAEDAIELEAHRVVLDRQGDEGVVEEPPALARPALDESQVVGREHGDPHHAEEVAGPRQSLPVDLHPAPAGRRDLGLDQRLPPVVVARARRGRRRSPRRRGRAHRWRHPGSSTAWPGRRAPRRGSSCPARCRRRRRSCPASARTSPPRSCGSRRARAAR